jgi:hypothetical protein
MQLAACFRHAAREIRSVLMDRPGVDPPLSPGARSLPSRSDDSRDWPWLRMQTLRRDGYRCRGCGRQGDEITLQVCEIHTHRAHSPLLMALCVSCQSHEEHLAKTSAGLFGPIRSIQDRSLIEQ